MWRRGGGGDRDGRRLGVAVMMVPDRGCSSRSRSRRRWGERRRRCAVVRRWGQGGGGVEGKSPKWGERDQGELGFGVVWAWAWLDALLKLFFVPFLILLFIQKIGCPPKMPREGFPFF